MLLTRQDFKLGQEVACMHSGNLARRNKGYTLGKVTKCGRKLVTVQLTNQTVQFMLEEKFERDYLLQKSNTSGDYELFPSEKDYFEFEEKNEKLSQIKLSVGDIFSPCKLSIDQVRRIYDIINE